MTVQFHILNASGYLTDYVTKLRSTLSKSAKKIQSVMLVSDVDVVLRHNPEATIPNFGIGGYAPDGHTVYISLDANNMTSALGELPHTLAHELHHCMRWRTVGYGETLGEALVTEGLAQVFEREVFGEVAHPWSNALTKTELESVEEKARATLWQPYDHAEWFFGTGDIPYWAGYTLSYNLVKDYVEKRNRKASALYSSEAKIILKARLEGEV
jgi:uncharacterized protein YjaZ